MSNCECQLAGFCVRYNRVQAERHWQICQGVILSPQKCEVYRENWSKLAKVPKRSITAPPTPPRTGPGTALKKLLAELGIKDFAGCGCESKAAQMNIWGVDGCRENFEAICGWIAEAQAKAGWLATITAAALAATTGLALELDLSDIPGSLVRLAIDRAAVSNTTTSEEP